MTAPGASEQDDLGLLLEAFVSRISHPRGRALGFMTDASVTVPQVILLNYALTIPRGTPSSLAQAMHLSLPSISQMIDRLVTLGLLRRREDSADRRRKEIDVTDKGRAFLQGLKDVRVAEFVASTTVLTRETRDLLSTAIGQALHELEADPGDIGRPRP